MSFCWWIEFNPQWEWLFVVLYLSVFFCGIRFDRGKYKSPRIWKAKLFLYPPADFQGLSQRPSFAQPRQWSPHPVQAVEARWAEGPAAERRVVIVALWRFSARTQSCVRAWSSSRVSAAGGLVLGLGGSHSCHQTPSYGTSSTPFIPNKVHFLQMRLTQTRMTLSTCFRPPYWWHSNIRC